MSAVDDLLTTRQLCDLLQVDRITIYRMLQDGRLRGFKVGGQWRFSQRQIEAWLGERQVEPAEAEPGRAAGGGARSSLPELPLACVEGVQAVCAEALDVAAVTTDLEGEPLAGVSNSCAFCDQILSAPGGRQGCARSWRETADGRLRPCHAGLLCAALPVVVGGQTVALVALCQFDSTPSGGLPEPAWQAGLASLAAGLGLDEPALRAAAGSIRLVPDAHQARVGRLLRRLAVTLAEIGQERLHLVSRLQTIAEMSTL